MVVATIKYATLFTSRMLSQDLAIGGIGEGRKEDIATEMKQDICIEVTKANIPLLDALWSVTERWARLAC